MNGDLISRDALIREMRKVIFEAADTPLPSYESRLTVSIGELFIQIVECAKGVEV